MTKQQAGSGVKTMPEFMTKTERECRDLIANAAFEYQIEMENIGCMKEANAAWLAGMYLAGIY